MDAADSHQDRASEVAARLAADHAGLDGSALLEPVIRRAFPGRGGSCGVCANICARASAVSE